MKSSSAAAVAARNENSVQASLAELRNLELARIEAEKMAAAEMRQQEEERALAAEKRRLEEIARAEERRQAAEYDRQRQLLAAQHEHELAVEKARAEAEARVQEKRLELDVKRSEAELLEARALHRPRRRPGPILAVAAILLAIQGFLFWQQSQSEKQSARAALELRAARDRASALEGKFGQLEKELQMARADLEKARDQAQSKANPATRAGTGKSGRNGKVRNGKLRPSNPASRPGGRPAVTIDPKCANNPLC